MCVVCWCVSGTHMYVYESSEVLVVTLRWRRGSRAVLVSSTYLKTYLLSRTRNPENDRVHGIVTRREERT